MWNAPCAFHIGLEPDLRLARQRGAGRRAAACFSGRYGIGRHPGASVRPRPPRRTTGRRRGTPAASSRKGRVADCRATRSEWQLIRRPVAARTSSIFMSPASPRRSLISCAATKRKFTKPGLFLARAARRVYRHRGAHGQAAMQIHVALSESPIMSSPRCTTSPR